MRTLMLLFLIQILYLGDGALIGYQLLVPDLESQVQKEFVKLPNGGLDQDELKNLQNINRHYYSPFAVALFKNQNYKGMAQLHKILPENDLKPDVNNFTSLWLSPWFRVI